MRQFILCPPFAWRWNRATGTFTTTAGTQDYQKSVSNFGWLEAATWNNGSGATQVLSVRLDLGEEVVTNQPALIAARLDDDAGNITFRIMPVPDETYTVTFTYQLAAPQFTALTGSGALWTPIPDYLSYLYNQGVLAKAYEFYGDERTNLAMQLFIKQVIAANAGLSDSQINMFLNEKLNTQKEVQDALGKVGAALQARGLTG